MPLSCLLLLPVALFWSLRGWSPVTETTREQEHSFCYYVQHGHHNLSKIQFSDQAAGQALASYSADHELDIRESVHRDVTINTTNKMQRYTRLNLNLLAPTTVGARINP